MKPYLAPRPYQRGIVLISGIVMLVMMTLIAISMIRLGTRHTQIVNNEQLRTEAESAATYALDLMLNDSASTWDVYKAGGRIETINIGLNDMSANSTSAIDVRLRNLECKRVRIMMNAELLKKIKVEIEDGEEREVIFVPNENTSCWSGDDRPQPLVFDTSSEANPNEESLCAMALYEVRAETSAPQLLEANVTITQGVEVMRSLLDLGCD